MENYCKTSYDRSLINIAKQGLLLINASLTTIVGDITQPHFKYWKPVSIKIIKYVTDNTHNLPILLLGKRSQMLNSAINKQNNHDIFLAPHPSSRNAIGINILKKSKFFEKMRDKGNRMVLNYIALI